MLPEGPWPPLPPPASFPHRVQCHRRVRKRAGIISSPGKERRKESEIMEILKKDPILLRLCSVNQNNVKKDPILLRLHLACLVRDLNKQKAHLNSGEVLLLFHAFLKTGKQWIQSLSFKNSFKLFFFCQNRIFNISTFFHAHI